MNAARVEQGLKHRPQDRPSPVSSWFVRGRRIKELPQLCHILFGNVPTRGCVRRHNLSGNWLFLALRFLGHRNHDHTSTVTALAALAGELVRGFPMPPTRTLKMNRHDAISLHGWQYRLVPQRCLLRTSNSSQHRQGVGGAAARLCRAAYGLGRDNAVTDFLYSRRIGGTASLFGCELAQLALMPPGFAFGLVADRFQGLRNSRSAELRFQHDSTSLPVACDC